MNEKSMDELTLQIDPYALGLQGLHPPQIASALSQRATPSYPAMWLTYRDQRMPVYLQATNANQFSTYQLLTDQIEVNESSLLLGDLARLTKQRTANAIHKEDRQYIRQIGFDYYGSFQFGDKYLSETLAEITPQLPAGYTAKKISWSLNWNKTKRQYGLLALLIAGIFVLSTILFENFKLPVFIILAIPVAYIGLFLSFGWFDFYFDQGGYAAFVLLGGLVVNSTIFIITDLVQLKQKTNRQILKKVTYKMKPILLTTLSTCLGLVPFLIGGQTEIFWFALAVGTIGGLMLSTLYTTFIFPSFMLRTD